MAQKLANITDEYQWALNTAKAVRAGKWNTIDRKALLNELECSIAGGIRRQLLTILRSIIEAILVIDYTKGDKRQSDLQLVEAQGQLQLLLDSAPSIQKVIGTEVKEAYAQARANVVQDYGVAVPEQCPVSMGRIMEDPYERVMAEEQA